MENSEEKNLLQGSITDRLSENMRAYYKREDEKKDVTVKNDGPGSIKCQLFEGHNESPYSEREVRAGEKSVFNDRGDTFKVETKHQSAAFTIENAKRPY